MTVPILCRNNKADASVRTKAYEISTPVPSPRPSPVVQCKTDPNPISVLLQPLTTS
jgi:hypothetical protein